MNYELIKPEQRGRVGLMALNRSKQMNALNPQCGSVRGANKAPCGPYIGARCSPKGPASSAGAR